MTRVALLAADGTLFSRRQGRWWWFDNITGRRLGGIRGVFGQPGHLGQQISHLFGKIGDLLTQRSDGGIALGELRRQFGNALLIGLLGTYIHAALTNPLIQNLLSDGSCEMLKSYAKLFYGNLFTFLLGGVSFTCGQARREFELAERP